MIPVTLLVMAKAPVPGLAKTRLAHTIGNHLAAVVAAAALLDTLDAVCLAGVRSRVVALTGDLDSAACSAEIRERLADFTVIAQRGDTFADRLANAHADAAAATDGAPVLQIGMDTPQVTGELLTRCAGRLLDAEALLGMAVDGGWWVLGVRSAASADCLRQVPMSQSDTGALTRQALQHKGLEVTMVDELADVDTAADVDAVRRRCHPGARFPFATAAAGL